MEFMANQHGDAEVDRSLADLEMSQKDGNLIYNEADALSQSDNSVDFIIS
ncbi:hypothetical protein Scep_027000 [Stephania cephalantha]|uniref:Uncharacterized protein n=1 Tax=Stephania cephalantha TaxID=152367 RepID=A0AAP0ELC7_9MAGN